MSDMSLRDKRVVIIGGGSGVGFAVAELAQALGAAVTIASSNEKRVQAAVERLPGSVGLQVDVRDEASLAALFAQVGPFDHLVVTAGDWGGEMFTPTRDLDLVVARKSLDVRFWGALAAAKQASASMAPGGSITLTSGMLAHRPVKGGAVVAALAGAVEFLARGLAVDLAPVRVNVANLGLILTDQVLGMMPPQMIEATVAGLPVPRGATPAEAATAYVYLMLNTYVTGQVLAVDGGGLLV